MGKALGVSTWWETLLWACLHREEVEASLLRPWVVPRGWIDGLSIEGSESFPKREAVLGPVSLPDTLLQTGQQRLLLTFLQVNARLWGPPELWSYPSFAILLSDLSRGDYLLGPQFHHH